MAKQTPKVQYNQLWLSDQERACCAVDSPAWFDWLATATTFRYFSRHTQQVVPSYARPLCPISVHKERRRQGYMWYANRRAYGQLHKRYVGPTAAVTMAKLDDIALELNQV